MFLKLKICFKKQRQIKGVTVYSKKIFFHLFFFHSFHPGVVRISKKQLKSSFIHGN